ncbi:sarcosine oxidase subunit gamma [Mycolicibacterium sp. 018/SC-01/001]|uniref:sarcosine oxidase subunit gamma n=1 Tax=Mycolicibacterium sp. 018/SC-01/001 TaxID=2592069 RepID=UPI00117D4656|nr:sarcosine oxidase subunit gamma family protein [Mycolicibacterium sp. 018/SC-01/001]TRW85480.1 sarcosine oxidase subunit gamma [Mycolicibacterium sp. 018/SC-01/001]
MADTLTRRSPLHSHRSRLAALPPSASVAEEPFFSMVDLWVDPAGPGAGAAANVLGVDALPVAPSTVVDGPDASVIWLGPQEWLAISATRDGEELEAALRAAVATYGVAAVDVSAQRTSLRLRGANARAVLAKGCSLDLHPRVFGPGDAAQTMLGHAGVVLMPMSDDGTDYRVIVRSSFARYLADWLIDAAGEFAITW